LAVLLTVGVAPAWAQSDAAIRGQVTASADNSALSGVTVTVGSLTTTAIPVSTSTDASGRFLFQSVRPGTYVLSIAVDGFVPREIEFVLEPREIKSVMLALDLRPIALNVEVRGSRSESTHSPNSTVLTGERIESLPMSERANMSDVLLNAAPGMIRADNDFVHVRGHEIGLSLLINGVAFWENPLPAFSGGISPDIVDTANVMTGGFAAEYGNRFGGVVDIVTKSGFNTISRGSMTGSMGQAGRRSIAGDFGGHKRRLGYYMFASVNESERFQSPPDPVAIHDRGRSAHGFLQLDGNLGRAGFLRTSVMGDGADFEVPQTRLDQELRPHTNAGQHIRQQTAIIGWTRAASKTVVGVSGYQRRSTSRVLPARGPQTAMAYSNRNVSTLGVKVDVSRFAGRHAVKAGVDAVRLRPEEVLEYDYSGYAEFAEANDFPILAFDGIVDFQGSRRGSQISTYVQDAIHLAGGATVDVGIRVDRYDVFVSQAHVSPRVNLTFRIGDGAVLHASYNHFFEPPPIDGVISTSAGLTAHIDEIGNALPPLKPAIGNQFEIGASGVVGSVRLGFSGYYQKAADAVHTTVWPDSRIYSHASFEEVRARGVEARVEVPGLIDRGITGHLNYAMGRISYCNPVTGGFVTEAAHVEETGCFLAPMDQLHTSTGGLTYNHRASGLWLGTTIDYGSGTPLGEAEGAFSVTRAPAHLTANVAFGAGLRRDARGRSRLSLRIDVQNITNRSYLIAREDAEFSPALWSHPRLVSLTAKVHF
jgi:outer membrane cobalamin receptor